MKQYILLSTSSGNQVTPMSFTRPWVIFCNCLVTFFEPVLQVHYILSMYSVASKYHTMPCVIGIQQPKILWYIACHLCLHIMGHFSNVQTCAYHIVTVNLFVLMDIYNSLPRAITCGITTFVQANSRVGSSKVLRWWNGWNSYHLLCAVTSR